MKKTPSRRKFLRGLGLAAAGSAVAACQPKTVVIEKEVTKEVEKVITQVVEVEKEVTKIVAGTPVVEKVIETQVVEKVVTATPVASKFEDQTLTIAHWWGAVTDIAAAFQESMPELTVEFNEIPFAGYNEKMLTQLAAGSGQDVYWIEASNFVSTWRAEAVLPLNDYFDADQIDMTKWPVDPAVDSGMGGTIYGVPQFHPDSPNIYCNVPLFEEAGIQVPAYGTGKFNTWKWDDFREAAIAMTKRDASGEATQWGSSYFLGGCWGPHRDLVWSNGGEFLDDRYHLNETKTMVTEPEFVEAYQWMADLYLKDQTTLTPSESELFSEGAWLSGKVAMVWGWGDYSSWKKARFEWSVIPTPWQVRRPNKYGGASWTINPATEVPDAAWEFIKWIAIGDGRIPFAKYGLMCYDPVSLLPYAEGDLQRLMWNTIMTRAEHAAEDDAARPYALGRKSSELGDALSDAMDEIILSGASVEEQLQAVADRIDPMLAEGA